MIVFKKAEALHSYLQKLISENTFIGFVPTMGALHEGHIALINKAKQQDNFVVCSIFINPTQFNNKTDFEKYPVTIEHDILLLEENKTDVLFLPSIDEIYPDGTDALQHFNLGYLENILEGLYRPGHFQGVCNVVHKLLDIVKPDIIFLGQKDYQQTLVLKRMMQEFQPNVKMIIEKTLREDDGLAMSSRNMRLSDNARKEATAIYEALQFIKQNIKTKNLDEIKRQASSIIINKGFDKIDYIEICDAETLLPANDVHQCKNLIALAAAFIEKIRLIDNLFL